MAKKLVSLLMICAVLFAPCPALAQTELPQPPTPSADEPDVGAAVSPLRRYQVAPFTGVLLSPRAVAVVTTELKSIESRIKIEVDRATATCEARADFRVTEEKIKAEADKKVMSAQLETRSKENQVLTDRLERAEKSAGDKQWWAGGGFVGGALVTILIVFGVSHATPSN